MAGYANSPNAPSARMAAMANARVVVVGLDCALAAMIAETPQIDDPPRAGW